MVRTKDQGCVFIFEEREKRQPFTTAEEQGITYNRRKSKDH
jgi:hypothetical protein